METTFPREYDVHILLDDAPHYKGSIHDDAVARARGYKAALIPGAFVYGHISRGAIEAWGQDWAERGAMSARFRKPVYNHDDIRVSLGPVEDDGTHLRSAASVRNGDGEEVATGWIALAHEPVPPPDPSSLKVLDLPADPPAVKAGELPVGAPLHSRQRVLTIEDFRVSLSAFAETHPLYQNPGFVHSGMLMRTGMGDVNSGWKFPAAVVLVEAETQHFRPVYPGQTIRTAGQIADTYERKGKHYFVTDEVLLADGLPAARFRRTQIYG
jgi:acyl dehydratase